MMKKKIISCLCVVVLLFCAYYSIQLNMEVRAEEAAEAEDTDDISVSADDILPETETDESASAQTDVYTLSFEINGTIVRTIQVPAGTPRAEITGWIPDRYDDSSTYKYYWRENGAGSVNNSFVMEARDIKLDMKYMDSTERKWVENDGVWEYKIIDTDEVLWSSGNTCPHNWGEENTTLASCGVPGKVTHTCTLCGEVETIRTIPATGNHTWDEGIVTTPPGCKEGTLTKTCTVCSETTEDAIPATGEHDWNNGVQTKEPECVKAGEMTYTCSNCGDARTEPIEAPGHQYADGSDVCTKCGVQRRRIIEGDGSKYTVKGKDGITFKANGGDDKIDILIDGSPLPEDSQITQSSENGTWVVSLPSEYLDTLKAGAHRILFQYENGDELTATFTIVGAGSGTANGNTNKPGGNSSSGGGKSSHANDSKSSSSESGTVSASAPVASPVTDDQSDLEETLVLMMVSLLMCTIGIASCRYRIRKMSRVVKR